MHGALVIFNGFFIFLSTRADLLPREEFFGLALDDAKLVNKRKSDWNPPNIMKQKNHEQHIRSLREQQTDYG